MDWQLLSLVAGGIGIGSILSSIITNIFVIKIQKDTHKQEKETWYRDNRLRAFSGLIRHLLSLGETSRSSTDRRTNYLNSRAIATEAILLINDTSLSSKVVNVIDQLHRISDLPTGKEREDAISTFHKEASQVIDRLRNYMSQ